MSRATLRIDAHMHTEFSYDSEAPLDEVLARARTMRIGRLCVTDHDTIEGALRLRDLAAGDPDVVVGCEFDADDGSQVVGLDLPRMIHQPRLLDLLHAIRSEGGRVLLPHPFRRSSGVFRPEMRRSADFIDDVLSLTDFVEAFNGHDTYENNAANLAFVRERGLAGVVSSDAHRVEEIGLVFMEYEAEDAVVGRSPGRAFFPTQAERREPLVKRRLLELYHRHQGRMPGVVRSLYHATRSRYVSRPYVDPSRHPSPQFELPVSGDREAAEA